MEGGAPPMGPNWTRGKGAAPPFLLRLHLFGAPPLLAGRTPLLLYIQGQGGTLETQQLIKLIF